MKFLYTSIFAIMLFAVANLSAEGHLKNTHDKDTIEVHFGNSGKILIQVDSKEDLDALKEYDINSMLEDVKVPTRAELENSKKVILEDDEGNKYLKDSIEQKEFRQLEFEFNSDEDEENDELKITYRPNLNKNKDNDQPETHNGNPKVFSGDRTTFISGMDMGINNFLENGSFPDANNEQYTVRPWGSWYVAIMPTLQTYVGGKFALDYGAGISWYNFKFQDPRTKLVEGEDGAEFEQWDVDLQASKSKLTVIHLNAHFVPMFDFGYRTKTKTYDDGFVQQKTRYNREGFRIGAGAYVGTRIGSYQKLVWQATGHKSKMKEKDSYYLENIRYGARFVVGYGEVDVFVNYDLSTVFAKNRGPELNAFTFGLTF